MKIAFIQNRLLSRKISFEKERSIACTEFYMNSSNNLISSETTSK